MRPSTLALCFLAILWLPCDGSTPYAAAQDSARKLPSLPEGDRLASSTRRINKDIRNLFLNVSGSPEARALPGDQVVKQLRDQLEQLEGLDAALRGLGTKPGEQIVRERMVRDRSLAFLHAWAVLSLLTDRASRAPAVPALRDSLIALRTAGSVSALQHLLKIFRQIREGQSGTADPLRSILASRVLAFDLAYRQPWRNGEDRGKVEHDYYIPSAGDLVGVPGSAPKPDRQLLSLWALVNLQLDTWHNADFELNCLASWLLALADQKELPAFFGSSATGTRLADAFCVRITKLGKFIRFRSEATNPAKLRDFVDQIYKARTEPGVTISQVVPDLVEAATPVLDDEASPADSKGWVRDAEVWLRYLLLLSYRTDRTVLLDVKAKNNIGAVWKNLEPEIPLLRPRDRREDRPVTGFLRWSRDPDECHSTALLADVVQALLGYYDFDARMSGLETCLFRTVTSGSEIERLALAEQLDRALATLKSVDQDCLARYRPGGVLEPLPAAFRDSATAAERGRWYQDVLAVGWQVEGTVERVSLLAQLYRANDLSQSLPALERLGGLSSLVNWNINEMPRRTFRDYHDDLKKKITLLEVGAQVAETANRLRREYSRSREQLQLTQLVQRAARLGTIVAEKAVRVSELYERVSNIDSEIADIGVKIASLQEKGASKSVDAAGLRLNYATRLRDLAAARVDALVQACSDATEIARKAEDELKALANQFEGIAKRIHDEKESSSLFGIIKAVVNVVGAVLAPFTGGASLAVSQLANKGLDIYHKIEKGNWSDPFAAVATVSEVAGDFQGAVNVGVKELGGPGASRALADVQTFLTSARDKIDQLKTLSAKGQKILNAFKAVKKGDAARFVTALANGFPMTVDAGGELRIDLGAKKIEFKNPELQSALTNLYALGGHIVNDATSRERLEDLPALPDSLLRGKLREALERGVQALPSEVRNQVLKLPQSAEDKLQAELAKAEEKMAQVVERSLSEEERRVFASVLAGGMLFVQSGQVVVAFERPLDRELERLQERMKRVAERAYSDTIQKLLSQLEEKRNRLSKRADELAGQNDDAGMRRLADETKREIGPDGSIRHLLSEVRKELDKAQEELEDRNTETKIATYESEAARLKLDAASLGLGSAEKQRERASLIVESARLQGEIARTTEEQATLNAQIAEFAVTAAKTELQRAYREALLHGLNPEIPEGAADSSFPDRKLSLESLLSGELDPSDEGKRSLVRRIASDLVGMIQWAELLRLKPKAGAPGPASPADAYRTVIEILTTNLPFFTTKDADPKDHKAGRLDSLSSQMAQLYRDRAGEQAKVMIQSKKIGLKQDIRWIGLRSDRDLDLLFPTLDQSLRHQILGVFNLRFATARQSPLKTKDFSSSANDLVELFPPGVAPERSAYFVDMNSFFLKSDFDNLSFIGLTPTTTLAQGSWAVVSDIPLENSRNWQGPLASEPRPLVRNEAVVLLRKSIEGELGLWKGLRLVGGLGEWTFLLLGNGVTDQVVRRRVIKDLRDQNYPLDLCFPYLQVQSER